MFFDGLTDGIGAGKYLVWSQGSPEIPAKQQKIRVAVLAGPEIAPNSVRLLVNGQPLFRGTETLWQLSPGHYVFEAVGEGKSGTLVRESVEIEVE
jgi:hypothetical protein